MVVQSPNSDPLPWPRRYIHRGREVNLAEFIPSQWTADGYAPQGCKRLWHAARADVARQLNRPIIDEIKGMGGWD